jgi:hypothetical protein
VIARARTVNAMLDQAGRLAAVRRSDLRSGDGLLVTTENSVYCVRVHEDATYSISGGWFDSQGLSPAKISISGCTWGGSAIKCDIVAACGLRLEFGNRVVTSRIRAVRLVRREDVVDRRFLPIPKGQLFRACYGSDSDRS